jgi:hypothetical protein
MSRAREALALVAIEIEYDEFTETTDGEEIVMRGLSTVATALSRLKGLDLEGAPLDMVLAEIGADKEIIEAAAELIEMIGRTSYTGGLSSEQVEVAEELRGFLYDRLDELLSEIEEEQNDG